jgi:hypothetical protein
MSEVNAIQLWKECNYRASELGLSLEISSPRPGRPEEMVLIQRYDVLELGRFTVLSDVRVFLDGYRRGIACGEALHRSPHHYHVPAPKPYEKETPPPVPGEGAYGMSTTTREMLTNWDSESAAQAHAEHIAKHQAIVAPVMGTKAGPVLGPIKDGEA